MKLPAARCHRPLHLGPHPFAVLGVDYVDVRLERSVEVEWVDSVDAMELVAPLHGAGADVPQPAAHVGQGLAFLQPAFDLGQRGLGQALLGDVPDHDH